MSTIVTRLGKGTALTWEEADANFTNLNLDKLEAGFSSSLVEYLPVGTGAVTTTVQTKLRESVSVKDFGAVGDGITDDTAAVSAACVSLGVAGGTILIPHTMKLLIDTALTIPPNVSIQGPHNFVGSPSNNGSAPYGNLGGVLIINPAVTVSLSGGSSISGCLIYRKGMAFPAADASLFEGEALTAIADDVTITNSMILGFNLAFRSNGVQRPILHNLRIDCNNGIIVEACFDIAYVTECHCWPFATIANGSIATSIRTGTAFRFLNGGDWNKLTNCFSWGYFRGCHITSCNSMTLLGCGFDNYYAAGPQHANSIGITIDGTCEATRIVDCQTAAQATAGVFLSVSDPTTYTAITGHNCWGGSTHGVLIHAGNAIISGGGYSGTTFGVSCTDTNARVQITDNWFNGIVTTIFNSTVPNPNCVFERNQAETPSATILTSNLICPNVATGAALDLPFTGEVVYITGTTNFGAINSGWNGRTVTLLATASVIALHSVGVVTAMSLAGGMNFSMVSGDSLTLRHNGVQWHEVGRSAGATKSGQATILTGTSDIAVAHGLPNAPSKINVVPYNTNISPLVLWVGSVTDTHFNINVSGNVLANSVFLWEAGL